MKLILDLREDRSYLNRLLFFEVCHQILNSFSRKFFRNHFFYGYLGLSRDVVPNIRIAFVKLLPIVRQVLRIPADNSLLSKLIDAAEALSTRDSDGGVIAAVQDFYKKYGMLHVPTFISEQKGLNPDFGSDLDIEIKKTRSDSSLNELYLWESPHLEYLDSDPVDKEKEDQEQKDQIFLLDPSRRKEIALPKKGEKKAVMDKKLSKTATFKFQPSEDGQRRVSGQLSSIPKKPTENTLTKGVGKPIMKTIKSKSAGAVRN
jgi:hypothetical protein